MKKSVIIILWYLPFIAFSQRKPTKLENMGLVAELMSIKLNAEAVTSMVLSSDSSLITEKNKKDVLEDYNELRVMSIPLIAQLIANISSENNLKLYKKLDELLTDKSIQNISLSNISDHKIKSYISNIQKLDNDFEQFYNKAYNLSHPSRRVYPREPAVADIISAFTAIETAVKDFNEAKGKKVDKIVVILDATKLVDISDLMKPSDKKDKKKDES